MDLTGNATWCTGHIRVCLAELLSIVHIKLYTSIYNRSQALSPPHNFQLAIHTISDVTA